MKAKDIINELKEIESKGFSQTSFDVSEPFNTLQKIASETSSGLILYGPVFSVIVGNWNITTDFNSPRKLVAWKCK